MDKKYPEKSERLLSAVNTIAEIISDTAQAMKKELGDGDGRDIKQLKELTLAAKELAGVMKSLDGDGDETDRRSVTVAFDGEGESWAI